MTAPAGTARAAGGRPVPLLQPGVGPLTGEHYVPATPRTVSWGRLPRGGDEPVLTVGSGAVVTIDTVSHEGILEDQGRDPLAYFGARGVPAGAVLRDAVEIAATVRHDPDRDGPHVVTGPIAVRGARPGDVLAVTVLELLPRADYGIVSNRHGRGALPGELPEGPGPSCVFCTIGPATTAGEGLLCSMRTLDDGLRGPAIRFPLRTFLGIMGVAPAGRERRGSVAPGDFGGNLDVSLLGTGSTLHLPVQVDGALFYVGDPHFSQGDGEVSLTAFEAPLRATVRLDLVQGDRVLRAADGRPLMYGETDGLLIPIGLHEDLDEAVRHCVRDALDLLGGLYGLDRGIAYAYLSATVDLSVSQVVDQVKGIHASIRTSDLSGLDVRHRGRR